MWISFNDSIAMEATRIGLPPIEYRSCRGVDPYQELKGDRRKKKTLGEDPRHR